MKFKNYLIQEGTTGKAAWEKYFAFNELETTLKKEGPYYDNDKTTKPSGRLEVGTKVRVHYTTEINKNRVPVTVLDKGEDFETYVHVDTLKKPGVKQNKFNLKPDVILGLVGDEWVGKPMGILRRLEKGLPDNPLSGAIVEYLLMLIKYELGKESKRAVSEAFNEIDQSTRRSLVPSVNKDFLEIVGAIHAFNKLPEAYLIALPVRGNEPLKDFDLIMKKGQNERRFAFSAKIAKSSTSNTLKPIFIAKALEKNPNLAKEFPREAELFTILHAHKTKEGYIALAKFLSKYSRKRIDLRELESYDDVQKTKAEEEYVKLINNMKLDFVGLVRAVVPEIYYIKGAVDGQGVPKFDIKVGNKIEKAKLRTKNTNGRLKDKIGLQL